MLPCYILHLEGSCIASSVVISRCYGCCALHIGARKEDRPSIRFCCLSVAIYSAVATGCVCMYCARCTCLHVCGMWDRPTNRVRTLDRVRVHGF